MPCYEPLKACIVTDAIGKKSISFDSKSVGKGVSLPCGRCIGCRLERARQWAVRIMHESKMHDTNCFLTLTYDGGSLPNGDCKCRKKHAANSLCVSDLQGFFKRLRARLGTTRIRFFACGEYGEKMGRPHYHAIVFGWFPDDAVYFKGSGELSLFTSSMLSSTWGHGHALVGRVSFDSASYVANYATKKVRGVKADAYYAGKRPEFLVMSRRPGIGSTWYEKFKSDVYPSDEVIINARPCRPPRYYDNLFAVSNPDQMSTIKLRREQEAEKLEEMVLSSGVFVEVAPTRNARRLKVRSVVAEAKQSLKNRTLEK